MPTLNTNDPPASLRVTGAWYESPIHEWRECLPRYRYNTALIPSLRVVGNWLGEAGFQVGRMVEVNVAPGVITLDVAKVGVVDDLRLITTLGPRLRGDDETQ